MRKGEKWADSKLMDMGESHPTKLRPAIPQGHLLAHGVCPTFKALKEVMPSMPFKVKLLFNII